MNILLKPPISLKEQALSLAWTSQQAQHSCVNTEDEAPANNYTPVEVRCYFVRQRNALLVRGSFSEMYLDYYLHLAARNARVDHLQDITMKEALAGMALHLASRPWNEQHAWNVHFENPLLNIFVCGDNTSSQVVGRCFEGAPRPDGQSLFLSQMTKKGMVEPRTSAVDLQTGDFLPAIEHFYAKSEQRLARYFEVAEEDFVLITAQPQCDLDWLQSLTLAEVAHIDKNEELSLLEKRIYHFGCGCNAQKICTVLLPHHTSGPDGLFGSDTFLDISCPRCGAEYRIQREQFEAFIIERSQARPQQH